MEKSRLGFGDIDLPAPADPGLARRLQQWKQACVERPDDSYAKEEFLAAIKDHVTDLLATAPGDPRIARLKRAANALSEDLHGRAWYPE